MQKTQKTIWTGTVFALLCAGVFAFCSYQYFANADADVFSENGMIENLQALTLFACSAIFLSCACRKGDEARASHIFFAVLFYSFFLREIPFKHMQGLPRFLLWLFHDGGKHAMVFCGFAASFILALMDFKRYFALSAGFLLSRRGALMLLGGTLLICAEIAEKSPAVHREFFEETLELCADMAFFYMSLLCFGERFGRAAVPPSV